MTNCDRITVALGKDFPLAQLLVYRLDRRHVIKKNIALGKRHVIGERDGGPDCAARSPRIQKQQPTTFELTHHNVHALRIRREFTAHMVVDADIAGKAVEPPSQTL